jgi:DNA-binding MarR family transcriptional regulator
MPDLFDYQPPPRAFARRTDPETSHEAAKSIEPDLTKIESTVLLAIPFAPGTAILDEVTRETGLDKVTASPRFKPLEEKGFIRRVGKRPGTSGRQQTSWERPARESGE